MNFEFKQIYPPSHEALTTHSPTSWFPFPLCFCFWCGCRSAITSMEYCHATQRDCFNPSLESSPNENFPQQQQYQQQHHRGIAGPNGWRVWPPRSTDSPVVVGTDWWWGLKTEHDFVLCVHLLVGCGVGRRRKAGSQSFTFISFSRPQSWRKWVTVRLAIATLPRREGLWLVAERFCPYRDWRDRVLYR